jgi:hypothetical protein
MVGVERVGEFHSTVMAGDVPLVRVGPLDGQFPAAAVPGAHLVDVLGKLVQRVTAR